MYANIFFWVISFEISLHDDYIYQYLLLALWAYFSSRIFKSFRSVLFISILMPFSENSETIIATASQKRQSIVSHLIDLFQKRMQLENMTGKQTDIATWLGLSLMGVQFGVLARLTWWEYSWDIMEPVTYFVTYGTAMACYAYYVLTKQVCYESLNSSLVFYCTYCFQYKCKDSKKRNSFLNLQMQEVPEWSFTVSLSPPPLSLSLSLALSFLVTIFGTSAP